MSSAKLRKTPECYLNTQPLGTNGFRLLTIEPGLMGSRIVCRLTTFGSKQSPSFHALSYVWGQEPRIHPITINDEEVPIRPNLFHAIQRIRLRGSTLDLWVDSLCINQRDDLEKNAQIRRISHIFHAASGVFVWLGEEDSTSKTALDFIRRLTHSNFKWHGPWWEQYGFTALANILERPWFSRGWVLQEAAFSCNSTIQCGDRQVHMDQFAMAVHKVRARLKGIDKLLVGHLAKFEASPATKLLDITDGVFKESDEGRSFTPKMSLENLVDRTTATETTDHRDTIYALLNLANDVDLSSQAMTSRLIVPDYGRKLLDVYTDFIMHCSTQSSSLDIICRPWAPKFLPTPGINDVESKLPSWITLREGLPFGDPSRRSTARMHGNPLAGDSFKRSYNAHLGTAPLIKIGRHEQSDVCDGSLLVRGIRLGTISRCSFKMANAIVTRDCLNLLGTITRDSQTGMFNLPDAIWRSLCADRDNRKDPAPTTYRSVMLDLLDTQITVERNGGDNGRNVHERSFDVEELLETELPFHVKQFLEVVRDTVWNRRTFRGEGAIGRLGSIVGLVPQAARVGDEICILYGCSVPVVLRKQIEQDSKHHWILLGEAYVYSNMDGKALRSVPKGVLSTIETDFEIR